MYSKDHPEKKAHVLIVEDDQAQAIIMQDALHDKYDVTLCPDAAEALRQLYMNDVDVILLDMTLRSSKMTGYQFLDYLKMLGKFEKTKVIAITGKSPEDMESNSSYEKLDNYLQKPVTKDGVIAAIEKALLLRTGENEKTD
jgi:DNA-binding NtrC family response regulator